MRMCKGDKPFPRQHAVCLWCFLTAVEILAKRRTETRMCESRTISVLFLCLSYLALDLICVSTGYSVEVYMHLFIGYILLYIIHFCCSKCTTLGLIGHIGFGSLTLTQNGFLSPFPYFFSLQFLSV